MRAKTDVEVVVLGRGHVQGALSRDPTVQTEVQSMLDRRRRQPSVRQPEPADMYDNGSPVHPGAGPMVVFCGIDNVFFEASRAVEAWWAGLASWTHNMLHLR